MDINIADLIESYIKTRIDKIMENIKNYVENEKYDSSNSHSPCVDYQDLKYKLDNGYFYE